MPHQCLQCGYTFSDDDAVQVLRGCQECKGTRFYYTEAGLTADERADLLRRSQQDLQQVVAEMLQREAPEAAAEMGDWAELRPRDLRRMVKEIEKRREETSGQEVPGGWEYEDARPLGIDTGASRQRVVQELEDQDRAPARPDTVQAGDGAYDIDVKGLLERNPIVVHKDGAYLIHLPSLFGKRQEQ